MHVFCRCGCDFCFGPLVFKMFHCESLFFCQSFSFRLFSVFFCHVHFFKHKLKKQTLKSLQDHQVIQVFGSSNVVFRPCAAFRLWRPGPGGLHLPRHGAPIRRRHGDFCGVAPVVAGKSLCGSFRKNLGGLRCFEIWVVERLMMTDDDMITFLFVEVSSFCI